VADAVKGWPEEVKEKVGEVFGKVLGGKGLVSDSSSAAARSSLESMYAVRVPSDVQRTQGL
jgi:hypothetical protein